MKTKKGSIVEQPESKPTAETTSSAATEKTESIPPKVEPKAEPKPIAETTSSAATEKTEPIPPKAEPKATPKPVPAKKRPEDVDLSTLNALVIEDDAGGMAIIGVMMRFLNIKAYINTTGEGVVAMALAMRPNPDIVFCDINLPNMTGYDVLKDIRAEERLKGVLVIAVTAQDADTEIPKARAAGFNGYIGKPLNRLRFPKQIRRIMAGEEVWETY